MLWSGEARVIEAMVSVYVFIVLTASMLLTIGVGYYIAQGIHVVWIWWREWRSK